MPICMLREICPITWTEETAEIVVVLVSLYMMSDAKQTEYVILSELLYQTRTEVNSDLGPLTKRPRMRYQELVAQIGTNVKCKF